MPDPIERIMNDYDAGRMSRRQLVTHLGALLALSTGAGSLLGAEDTPPQATEANSGSGLAFEATGLNHIALRVTDVPRSRDFYMKHLGLKLSRGGDNTAFLNCGKNFVALFRGDQARMDHYCYSVQNYDAVLAEEKLQAAGIPNIHRAGGRIYFSDPDGLTVQLAAEQHLPSP